MTYKPTKTSIWTRRHMSRYTDSQRTVNIYAQELSGSFLTYLIQNNLLDIKWSGNIHYKYSDAFPAYNFVIEEGFSIDYRSSKTKIVPVIKKYGQQFQVEHIKGKEDDIDKKMLKQTVIHDGTSKILETNIKYIDNIIKVLGYYIDIIDSESELNVISLGSKEIKIEDVLFFENCPINDIHHIKDNQINLKKCVILKKLIIAGKSYIIVGYPDIHKMTSHLTKDIHGNYLHQSELFQDIYNKYFENCPTLLQKFHNIVSPDNQNKFTDEEIESTDLYKKSIWKFLDDQHADLDFLKETYDAETYQKLYENYQEEANKILIDSKALQQQHCRIKYIFHILELEPSGKLKPMIHTLDEIKLEHQEVLNQVNQFIKTNLYQHHLQLPKELYPIKPNLIMNYIRFTGVFHIESEFINAIGNFYTFSYISFNLLQLEELIYSSSIPDFWRKVEYQFSVSSGKLAIEQPVEQPVKQPVERPVGQLGGGNPNIDISSIKILTSDGKDTQVVLFHIDNFKQIKTILHNKNKFYYMEMEPILYSNTDISRIITQLDTKPQQLLYKYDKKTISLYNLNMESHRIKTLQLIDQGNTELNTKLYKQFLHRIPINHDYFNFKLNFRQELDKRDITLGDIEFSNPNNQLPRIVKKIVILLFLKQQQPGNLKRIRNDMLKSESLRFQTPTIDTDSLITIKQESLTGIFYKKIDKKLKYLVWIIPSDMILKLFEMISNLIKNNKIIEDYWNKPLLISDFDEQNLFIRHVNDVTRDNKEEVIYITKESIKIAERTGVKLNYYVHSWSYIGFNCIHFKIEEHNIYNFNVSADTTLSNHSRNLQYQRFISNLNVDSNYYFNGIVNSYVILSWKFIYYNILYNKLMNITQLGGKKTLVTTKKIDNIPQYKKFNDIFNEFNYNDYTQLINASNPSNIIKNIDIHSNILKTEPNLNNIIQSFYNMVNIENIEPASVELATIINNIYNKDMLLLIPSINIIRLLNKIINSNTFDVVLNKGTLPVKFDKEVKGMDNINHYGSYGKTTDETYPDLVDMIGGKYKNVVIIPSATINYKYPSIYTPCHLPVIIAKVILGLSSLKNNGNMMIHLKSSFSYPLMEQLMNLIVYVFKTVEMEVLKCNKNSVVLHCLNFNKSQYQKLEDLTPLLSVLNSYVVSQELYPNIISNSDNTLFYPNNKSTSNFEMPSIVYKLKVVIPESKTGKTLTELMSDKFMSHLSEIHYKMNLYVPLNDEKTLSLLSSTIYSYIKTLVEFMEKHQIPYNKYYLSIIDDYYENIITSIYSFSNNINVQLINYPVARKSISLKRNKSQTKMSRKSRTKSIKDHKDYLHHITGTDKPYTYDGFTPSVKKLEYVKQTRRELMKHPKLNKLNKSRVTRVVEDFTRGISTYLHRRYKLDIIPSNAFTKLWEIYHHFNLVPNKKTIRMFHLAEAPGQFIKATEYYIKKNCHKNEAYLWKANSLNPHNKEVTKEYGTALFRDDYGLIKKFKQNWIWGKDDTGDITRSQNVKWYRQYLSKWSGKEPIDVVTGDGGLELDRQAVELQKLDYGQFLLAAATSSMGKHCVIKTFTPFLGNKPETFEAGGFFVGLIYLYSLLYREVYLFKPYTSRPTSGEYYIIGKGFVGLPDFALDKLLKILDTFTLNQTFFKKGVIPNSFVKQTYKFIEEMSNFNAQTIDKQNFFFACSTDEDGKTPIKEKTNCDYYLDPDNLKQINEARYRKWIRLFNFK